MKKTFIIVFFVFVLTKSNAQLITGFRIGSHLPASRVAIPGFEQIESDGTQTALVSTLGSGVDVNGMLGYEFNKNIILAFDIGYLYGFKINFYQYEPAGITTNTARRDIAIKATFFNVTPNLILKTNKSSVRALVPYARFGIHTGLASVTSTTEIAGVQGKIVDKYSGNLSLGLLSAFGITRQINKKNDWFIELTLKAISFQPKELRNIENVDGQKGGAVIRFVEELNPNGPTNNELIFTIPLSSIGFSFGFQHHIGK